MTSACLREGRRYSEIAEENENECGGGYAEIDRLQPVPCVLEIKQETRHERKVDNGMHEHPTARQTLSFWVMCYQMMKFPGGAMRNRRVSRFLNARFDASLIKKRYPNAK
jgi:hypothetical protein